MPRVFDRAAPRKKERKSRDESRVCDDPHCHQSLALTMLAFRPRRTSVVEVRLRVADQDELQRQPPDASEMLSGLSKDPSNARETRPKDLRTPPTEHLAIGAQGPRGQGKP